MNKLNEQDSYSADHDSFAIKASRFGFAWMCFSFFLILIIVGQFMILAFKPMQAVGVDEHGVVVGAVVFDEPSTRGITRIAGDVKQWAAACTSMNKISIFDDLSSCLAHLTGHLSDAKLSTYSQPIASDKGGANGEGFSYATLIREAGCERTKTIFNEQTKVSRYHRGAEVVAELIRIYSDDSELAITDLQAKAWISGIASGEVICILPNEESKSQPFKIKFLAQITSRTDISPLGIKVHQYEDTY